ncbi:hypothetical protein AB0O28_16825 [Microbispora sp. NPDC088329]|uniref:hypothetical protein n=1 Tax=Microbispora sp. NPDC088329 TaxID=3154869 RepID=UPI00341F22C6
MILVHGPQARPVLISRLPSTRRDPTALIYLHPTQDRDQAIAKALRQALVTAAGTKIEN